MTNKWLRPRALPVCLILLALLARPTAALAQTPVMVTPSFDGTVWLPRNSPIELRLSQPLPSALRVAVLIGVTDLSAAFAVTPQGLRFRPSLLQLPAGENIVVVSSVSASDEWIELARFPIRVLTTGGFEKSEVTPQADLNLHGQIAEGHDELSDAPTRARYQDLTVTAGLQATQVKDGWSVQTKANVIAVTHQAEALRYSQIGIDAPNVDLADYLVAAHRGKSNISVGSVVFGRNRLLLNNFMSRGVTGVLSAGRVSLIAGAMNGTAIVGWDNPLGISNGDHRVLAADLAFEAAPERPGALALQISMMNGSRLPISGFSQGAVTDAEQSHGIGVHVLASDVAQRIRVDGGYARSTFLNPIDPSLSQGSSLTPALETTGDARYADVSFDLLRSLNVTPAHSATLQAGYRHERADPLYKSVGGTTRADFFQNSFDLNGSLGVLSAQVNRSSGHDDLDAIASLLETQTDTTGAMVSAQLGALRQGSAAQWLPILSYNVVRVQQLSDTVPTGGTFTASDLPNLTSVTQNVAAQWMSQFWHGGYRLARTSQDNQQIGLETADFLNVSHVFSFGATPSPALVLSLDLALESSSDVRRVIDVNTRRLAGSVNWTFTRTSILAAGLSGTEMLDDPLTGTRHNSELHVELSQRINRSRTQPDRPLAQLFLRYMRQANDFVVPGTLTNNARSQWTVNTGLTLYVF